MVTSKDFLGTPNHLAIDNDNPFDFTRVGTQPLNQAVSADGGLGEIIPLQTAGVSYLTDRWLRVKRNILRNSLSLSL